MTLETFFEKFELFADAPNAVAKMRELIRSLAVSGQLGTGSAKPKWPTVKMKDVCSQITDGEHATPSRTANGVPLATAKNVRDGYLDLTNTDFVALATAEKCWKRCKPSHNDVLMVCVGATTGRVCLVENPPDIVLVRSVALIRPKVADLYPAFLDLFLRSRNGQSQVWAHVKQSAQPCLYLGKMAEFEIELPPHAEQRRIVAKVDELMALCDRLEAQQKERDERHVVLARASLSRFAESPTPANLDYLFHPSYPIPPADLRKAILTLAVQGKLVPQEPSDEPASKLLERIRIARAATQKGRQSRFVEIDTSNASGAMPYDLPSGWVWTMLGEVQVFTNGYAFRSQDYRESGIGIVRMGELGANGEIDESDMKYVSDQIAQSLPDAFKVKPGDLLMGMSGSIGKLAINCSANTYLLNQRVGRLEPVLIEKSYLHIFLRTVEQHYLEISFGMAIKNLSTKQINETAFPLPPLGEQQRIVTRVYQLMSLVDTLEALAKKSALTACDTLRALVQELGSQADRFPTCP